jgi:hypothetical protein
MEEKSLRGWKEDSEEALARGERIGQEGGFGEKH